MALVTYSDRLPTKGGFKTLVVKANAKAISLRFKKSLARYYGTIQMVIEDGHHLEARSHNVPFVRPKVAIRLPKWLQRIHGGQNLELWSRDSFRGNWHVTFELPTGQRRGTATFTLDLMPRFAGTKHEEYWGGEAVEDVMFEVTS